MLAGDEATFTAVVERHQSALIRFVQLFVASRSVAEEVVQDTWVAVLNGLPAFEGRSALKSWIFSIAANRAKSRGVRERRVMTFSDLSPEGLDEPSVDADRFTQSGSWGAPPERWHDEDPESLVLRREVMDVVEAAVAALPDTQRTVVTLRDIEGLDSVDVCGLLGISEANQRVLLHRGRSRVRQALAGHLAARDGG